MKQINSYSPISFVLDKEDNKGINNFDSPLTQEILFFSIMFKTIKFYSSGGV